MAISSPLPNYIISSVWRSPSSNLIDQIHTLLNQRTNKSSSKVEPPLLNIIIHDTTLAESKIPIHDHIIQLRKKMMQEASHHTTYQPRNHSNSSFPIETFVLHRKDSRYLQMLVTVGKENTMISIILMPH